jgi:hypothetical protein
LGEGSGEGFFKLIRKLSLPNEYLRGTNNNKNVAAIK